MKPTVRSCGMFGTYSKPHGVTLQETAMLIVTTMIT